MLSRDPLIHFLLIGGLLFAALSWLDRGPAAEQIVIGAAQVEQISQSAALLQGRPPTADELEALVRDAIRDEVYYREALALELDVNDDEVRRRLIEKMASLTENVEDPEPPATDLAAWFDAHAERFRIPELVTFEQIFFSPRTRGEAAEAAARAALSDLAAGGDPATYGDSTPLDRRFEDAADARVRVLFGDALTDAVFAAEIGRWIGPFESDFGWHIVTVSDRKAARDPTFAEVEAAVRAAYSADRLAAANEAAFAEMRSHYDIAVQWSSDSAPESWP